MKPTTSTALKLIETAQAHLGLLDTSATYDAGEAVVRAISGSLRALIVEDLLGQAWRASAIGGPMTFRTWAIKPHTPATNIVAFCGGGEILPGIPTSASWGADVTPRSLDWEALRRQCRIQLDGTKISTTELIKFVANTQGGVHFDPEGKSPKSRKPVFNILRDLEAGRWDALPWRVNNRNHLHHEVLSIAQAIVRSPEVQRLRLWRHPG